MKIYLAMWLTDRTLGQSLTKKGARKRLASYFFLKEQSISNPQLKQYIKTGRLDPRKNKT
jgi:hypothetical protein